MSKVLLTTTVIYFLLLATTPSFGQNITDNSNDLPENLFTQEITKILNFQISIFDIIISAGIAITIAFFILWLEHRMQKEPIRKSIRHYLAMVKDAQDDFGKPDTLFPSVDQKPFFKDMIRRYDRLVAVILSLYGSEQAETFDDKIAIWKQALQREEDTTEIMFKDMIKFLQNKLASF